MVKILQSEDELKNHLDEQLQLLIASTEAYDKGFDGEAKRIAATLRVLLHDTADSKSLLEQLGLKDQDFYDTAAKAEEFFSKGKRLGSFAGLVGIQAGDGGRYVPFFDESPPGFTEYVPFDKFWGRVVFIDNQENSFTRKKIILAVANQDGGTHVDPNLDEKYYQLSRENSMGWEVFENASQPSSPGKPELPALRQIAHEVLRTLIPEYPHKKIKSDKPVILTGILITKNEEE